MAAAKYFKRRFIAEDLTINTWDDLKPYADNLEAREWQNADDYIAWLKDWSEFETVCNEEKNWREIRPTLNTKDKKAEKEFDDFQDNVVTNWEVLSDKLNRRAVESLYVQETGIEGFDLQVEKWKNAIDIYREENVILETKDAKQGAKYYRMAGGLSVKMGRKKLTIPKAYELLESPDSTIREKAWFGIQDSYKSKQGIISKLYGDLVTRRHQIGVNAGFDNYRDYVFREKERFDYTPQQCKEFHQSVQDIFVPLIKKIHENRAAAMGVDKLRPWDLSCDPMGRKPLNPFVGAADLIEKTDRVLAGINPLCVATIANMKAHGTLDVESRKNKAPGGYNMDLEESGTSFIFMNLTGTQSDMTTDIHEKGHATQTYLNRDLPLSFFKNIPMEVAEMASMSLELLTHDQWHHYYTDPQDLARAQYDHLETIVTFMPYIMSIDAFQHEIYEKPDMTSKQRHKTWQDITNRYETGMIDYSGLEAYSGIGWQKKGHLFDVPFYYIEYGIAQIAALGIYKNSKENKQKAVDDYIAAISLGATKSLPEVYERAGVKLDFSANALKDIMGFVGEEMDKLAPIAFAPKPV